MDPQRLASQAVKGAFALALRQVWVHGANLVGGVLLARLLAPSEFGLYAIVLFSLTFFATFGGTGLAANLIRQREEPSVAEYRAVFTVQQGIVLILAAIIWIASPEIARAYRLSAQEGWLFRLISVSFFLTSFMVISQVQMERCLAFDKLAVVDAVQAVVFNASAVLFAWNGYKGESFAFALVLRSLAGVGCAQTLNPWPVGWLWNWQRARRHIEFGFYYQLSQVISLAKDTISPLFVGLAVGMAAVGYINWASSLTNYPVFALMLLNRLYLPIFAKLTHEPIRLRRAVEIVVSLSGALVFSASALLYVFRHQIIAIVFGDKWLVALPLFLPMVLINFLLLPTLVGFSVLNALGRSKSVLKVTMLLAASTWVLGPVFISFYGWQRWGWINLVAQLPNIFVLLELRQILNVNWASALNKPLIIACITGLIAEVALILGAPWIVAFMLGSGSALAASYLWLSRELARVWRSFVMPSPSAAS